MARVTFKPTPPRGVRAKGAMTIETRQLFFDASGSGYLRSGYDGSLVPLTEDQHEALREHYGRQRWAQLVRAAAALGRVDEAVDEAAEEVERGRSAS